MKRTEPTTARLFAAPLVALVALALAAPAGAAGPGGTAIPGSPKVASVTCSGQPAGSCGRGQLMTVTGESLQSVTRVEFLGARTSRDDVRVRIPSRAARPAELVVAVPRSARSGPVRLYTPIAKPAIVPSLRVLARAPATDDAGSARRIFAGGRKRAQLSYNLSGRPPGARVEAIRAATGEVVRRWPLDDDGEGTVSWDGFAGDEPARSGTYLLRLNQVAVQATAAGSRAEVQFELVEGFFPIRGRHQLASSRMQRFGGSRGHEGSDNFAACGTPLAAWTKGKVQYAGSHSRAGNYVVIERPNGESYAYMHMRGRALVRKGDEVFTGQRLGYVGDTGSASGCHLHFELWTAPGWYRGGRPYDSLPLMKRLDALS